MNAKTTNPELRQVSIGSLVVDPNQPRRDFGREAENKENLNPLIALSSSIKDQGILQPILVRPAGDKKFMIIAGERRWRAAQMAGLSTVPVLVRSDLEGESLEMAQLSENLQRQDLTDYDIALAVESIMERYPELKKKDLAKFLNRAPSYVSRILGMINPAYVSLVKENVITYASVLEAFKSKSKAVQEMAVKEAKDSGKAISHLSLSRIEKKLMRPQNAMEVPAEFHASLVADAGFSTRVIERPAATDFRVGTRVENRSENAPLNMVHQAKMGWDQFIALTNVMPDAPKPVGVEMSLTSAQIKLSLRALGHSVPRDEFDQMSALMDALRDSPPAPLFKSVSKARPKAVKTATRAKSAKK